MASGGWEFSTASGKLQGKISWSSSSNGSSANTSNITAILYARRVDGYTTTGQSWSGYVKIQGKDNSSQTNISFDHSVSIGGSWVEVARTTLNNAKHNDDGSGSATVSGSVTGPSGTGLSGITSSGSSGITLDKIARYTSIKSFTVSKRDETSLTFNWQTADTVDYVWYSKDNGSNWTERDVTDGTSGSFDVTGLSVGGTYNCKIRVRRKDSKLTTDSAVVSAKTNSRPTSQVTSAAETTITVKWTSDGTSNYIWYSRDNGSNWTAVGSVNATTGSYTITGCSAGTSYNIKTRVRKSNTSNTYDSNAVTGTTYSYPSCTSAPNFTIGNSVKLDFYNPLNRTMSIRMWSHVKQDFVTDAINVTGTTYTFTPNASTLYASIPSAKSSTYNIDVTYSGVKKVKTGGAYSVNESTSKPTFSNGYTFTDSTNNALTQAIGNNQILVQNVSTVNLYIASGNKMTPNNSASGSYYNASFGNLTKNSISYSSSDLTANMGVITSSGSVSSTVTAYDSRGLYTSATKSVSVIEYQAPKINTSEVQRLNNYETQTTVKLTGTFSRVTVSGSDKNAITDIQYRKKESTSSTWDAWDSLTISSQGTGSYSTSPITLQLDNSKQFNFQFKVTDRAKTTTVDYTINVGLPIMFLHTKGLMELNGNATGTGYDVGMLTYNNATGTSVLFGIGSGGTNHGIFSNTLGRWLINGDTTDNHTKLPENVDATGTLTVNNLRVNNVYCELNGGNTNNYLWHRIATVTAGTGSWQDRDTILLIKAGFDSASWGIVKCSLRTNNANNGDACGGAVRWLARAGFSTDGIAIGRWGVSGQNVYADIFLKSPGSYPRIKIWQYDYNKLYTLINSTEANDTTASDRKGSTECWKSITDAATALHGKAYTAISYGSMTTAVSYADSAGSAGTWSGNTALTNDHATLNTGDTWMPVIASGKLQHTLRHLKTGIGDLGYSSTNHSYVATISTVAYWNGAYSGSTSNLKYAHQGEIQCKPTSLYDNSSGTTGNITLSQTAANFSLITVTFIDSHSRYSSMSIWSPNGRQILLYSNSPFAKSKTCMADVAARKFNGTAFNLADDEYGTWNSWNNSWTRNNNIKIIKVLGWKL